MACLIIFRCPCCGENSPETHHFETLRCRTCGHAWYPSDKVSVPLSRLYGKSYFHGGDYADYPADESSLKRNFSSYCARMRRLLQPSADVLEVGCAYGFFLEVSSRYYRVSGIDIAEDAVASAKGRGLPVLLGDLRETPYAPESFDAVCFWDCLEHLDDPASYLASVHQLLRPAGMIFITTGDLSAPLSRMQGRRWRLYHPPTHLHYFTRSSLSALLERRGFQIEELSSIAQWHSLGNVFGGLSLHSKSPVLSRCARFLYERLPDAFARWHFPIFTGDIMWVAARKTDPGGP